MSLMQALKDIENAESKVQLKNLVTQIIPKIEDCVFTLSS